MGGVHSLSHTRDCAQTVVSPSFSCFNPLIPSSCEFKQAWNLFHSTTTAVELFPSLPPAEGNAVSVFRPAVARRHLLL